MDIERAIVPAVNASERHTLIQVHHPSSIGSDRYLVVEAIQTENLLANGLPYTSGIKTRVLNLEGEMPITTNEVIVLPPYALVENVGKFNIDI